VPAPPTPASVGRLGDGGRCNRGLGRYEPLERPHRRCRVEELRRDEAGGIRRTAAGGRVGRGRGGQDRRRPVAAPPPRTGHEQSGRDAAAEATPNAPRLPMAPRVG